MPDYRSGGVAETKVIRVILHFQRIVSTIQNGEERSVQMPAKKDSEAIVRDIKRKTRKKYNAEEKIRIVLDGLRGEESIAAICCREGINPNCVTTTGAKTSLKLVRGVFWVTRSERPRALK